VVLLVLGCATVLAAVAFIIAAYRRRWTWTGFVAGPEAGAPAGHTSKSLWDWLQLLIVPLALALAAFVFNAAQDSRDREREEDRAAREQVRADDRTREDALRGYLQQMSSLITEHHLRSRRADLDQRPTDAQALARTLTLTVLRRLDGERRGLVVQFLYEAGVISPTRHWVSSRGPRCARPGRQRCWRPVPLETGLPRVRLDGADLREAVLRDQVFVSAFGRCLTCGSRGSRPVAKVVAADLSGADLRNADLHGVDARGVNFDGANLRGADLGSATLAGATFDGACLTKARFDHAIFKNDQDWPDTPGAAYFGEAEGQRVDFRDAVLDHVDLGETRLFDIDLRGAFQRGTQFPRYGWTKTGLRGTVGRAAPVCQFLG
jgi:uncharacterized protein YjbI with pentapeptide repeats